MDKALAARAGLGWYGKNTNILTKELGSFVLLGEIITTLEIEPDAPLDSSCGACRLCLKACPTQALGPEYTIDSRKCISYLTIEHRGPIPLEYRDQIGDWVFGCDICQDVCPPTMRPYVTDMSDYRAWASRVRRALQPTEEWSQEGGTQQPLRIEGHPLYGNGVRSSLDLIWLLRLSHAEYVNAFRGSAIKRAKAWMLRRNACVALGNVGTAEAIPAVADALRTDEIALVRGHAAWALGKLGRRHGSPAAFMDLQAALDHESNAYVADEIAAAIAAGSSTRSPR
jgi:epoxyqueuosine reductase